MAPRFSNHFVCWAIRRLTNSCGMLGPKSVILIHFAPRFLILLNQDRQLNGTRVFRSILRDK